MKNTDVKPAFRESLDSFPWRSTETQEGSFCGKPNLIKLLCYLHTTPPQPKNLRNTAINVETIQSTTIKIRRQNYPQGQVYQHVGYMNHSPLHRNSKGHQCARISPDNIANIRAKWNLVRSYLLCHSHLAVFRKGRRRELKSTELTNYVSSALPMLSHLCQERGFGSSTQQNQSSSFLRASEKETF